MRQTFFLCVAAACAAACGGGGQSAGTGFSGSVRGQTLKLDSAVSDEGLGPLDGRRDPSTVIITTPKSTTCETLTVLNSSGTGSITIYLSAVGSSAGSFVAPTEPGEFPIYSGRGALPQSNYAMVFATNYGGAGQTTVATSGSVTLTSAKARAYTGSVNVAFAADTVTGTFASRPCTSVSTFASTVSTCDTSSCTGVCGSVASCQACNPTVKAATCGGGRCGAIFFDGGSCDCGTCLAPQVCGVDSFCHDPAPTVKKTGSINLAIGTSNTLSADFLEYTPGTESCTTADAGPGCSVRKCVFGSNPIGTSVYRTVGTVQATNGTKKISANPGSNNQYFALSSSPFAAAGDMVNLSWDGGMEIPAGSLSVVAGAPVMVGGTTPLTLSRSMSRSFPITGGAAGSVVANLIQQDSSGNVVARCEVPASSSAVTLSPAVLGNFANGAASMNLSNFNQATTTLGGFDITGSVQSKMSLDDGGYLYSLNFSLSD